MATLAVFRKVVCGAKIAYTNSASAPPIVITSLIPSPTHLLAFSGSQNNVAQALGYDPDYVIKAPSPGLFVVGGPVRMRNCQRQNICVVHATGLNFQTKTTLDFKRYYQRTDDEFESIVKQKLGELFHLCFSAAKDLGCTILRVPAIGLGLFMTACSEVRYSH